MVAKKRLEVDLRDGTGRVIKFQVPVNATPTQIGVLAQRAIKQQFPGEQFQRPRLDRPVAQQAKVFDASASATPNTLRSRTGNAARTTARAVGFSNERANQIAARTEGAADFVPGIGDALGAEDAKRAFDRGNYGEAAIGALATGVGLIPVVGDAAGAVTKAMFLGAKAQNADTSMMARAMGLDLRGRKAGLDPDTIRQQVWDETGWFKGADGKWRFETDDSALRLNQKAIPDPDLIANRAADDYARTQGFEDGFLSIPLDHPARHVGKLLREKAKTEAYTQRVPINDVVEGTPLAEAYPRDYSRVELRAEDNLRNLGSWEQNGATLRVQPPKTWGGYADPQTRSTVAHELQHFVQGQEGFARGAAVGAAPAVGEGEAYEAIMAKARALTEQYNRYRTPGPEYDLEKSDSFVDEIEMLHGQAEQVAGYEGYRRVAGEVEARNVQKRLDWSPEMRRAVPPWKTQEYPDDEQFKIWGGGGAAADAPPSDPLEMKWDGGDVQASAMPPEMDDPIAAKWDVADAPKVPASPKDRANAAFQEEGLDQNAPWSPYGMVKLKQPHAEMTQGVDQYHQFGERPVLRPEDMSGAIIPLVGDRARTGARLTSVGDTELSSAVDLQGGPLYPQFHAENGSPGVWASHKTVTSGIVGHAARTADRYGDVHGVYSAMGPRAVDFNAMTATALLRQLDNSPVAKAALRDFDEDIRKVFPKFVGTADPKQRAILERQLQTNAELRKRFVKRMDLAPRRNAGFPDVAATRYATSEPGLRDLPEGVTGMSIARIDPKMGVLADPAIRHDTYATQIGGEYLGGFEVPLRREEVFPDFYAGRRALGVDPYGDRRSFEISNVLQPITPRWQDDLSKIIERKKARGIRY